MGAREGVGAEGSARSGRASPVDPLFGTASIGTRSQSRRQPSNRPREDEGQVVARMAEAISPEGDGPSWLQQQANVARIFKAFVAQDSELTVDWDLLGAVILCDKPVYARFAGFLVHVYVIPAGVKNAGLPLAAQS
eukprot:6576835-Prymnesium_polylepis.1